MMSSANFRQKKIKISIYFGVFLGLILCLSVPETFYRGLQNRFVMVYSKITASKHKQVNDEAYRDIQEVALLEKIHLLEEQMQALHMQNFASPFFSEILSPYFKNLILGRVIYRDYSYWGSSCWVNVGKEHGVKKNSPVVVRKFLIGLIDYVGEKQSRVRLITDVGMKPSVVAVRGGIHAWVALEQLFSLISRIENLSDQKLEEKYASIKLLKQAASHIHVDEENTFQLRGVLYGRGGALWQPHASSLHGDLFGFIKGKNLMPGDILITTGLDGIFPPGLLVAEITKILPETEGACCLRIEADSLAKNCSLESAFLILPPMEFNPNDRPDIFGLLW